MKKFLESMYIIVLFIAVVGCEPDEPAVNDPNAPTIAELTRNVSTAPGYEFWMEATIKDDVQIKKVNLLKTDWHLDKDIILTDSVRTEYRMRYKFKTPEDAVSDNHKVVLTVEDIGGNITTDEIIISLDKDVNAPVIDVSSPTNGQRIKSWEYIEILVFVTDDTGIDTFSIESPGLGIDELYSFSPVKPSYQFRIPDFQIPELADGSYYINIKTSDAEGNQTIETIELIVGEVQSNEIYIVGGATWSGWDDPSSSNPMLMRHDTVITGWYEIMTYSFGIQDYNGVKFLGQRAWGPNNWGLETTDPSSAIINDEGSEKIVLDEEGYYKVRFSPNDLEYSVEKDVESTPVKSEMYILGSGIVGMDNAWINPSGAIAMTQDDSNPYIYTATVEFTPAGSDDWGATFIFTANKNDLSDLSLGFNYFPADAIDPAWADWQGYVIGDLSLPLDELTSNQQSNISEWPPNDGYWNGVPYIAYYEQAGTYLIKLDYKIKHASITKISE